MSPGIPLLIGPNVSAQRVTNWVGYPVAAGNVIGIVSELALPIDHDQAARRNDLAGFGVLHVDIALDIRSRHSVVWSGEPEGNRGDRWLEVVTMTRRR